MKILIDADLCCLPLRVGLISWGYVQLLYTVLFGIYQTIDHCSLMFYGYSTIQCVQRIFITIFFSIWNITDAICLIFLLLGLHQKRGTYLEVSYNYMKVKLPMYALLIMLCIILRGCHVLSRFWFDDHMETFTASLLSDYIGFSVLFWVMQLYLMIMMDTMMHRLNHEKNFSTLWRRLRHRTADNYADNLIQAKHEEEKKMLKDVC